MASIKLAGDTSGEITISAPAVAGTTTLELPATSSTLATQNALGVRNLIINGDMRIAQRGTSFTGVASNGYYTLDRFQVSVTPSTSVWTVTQSTDVPTGQGFTTSLKCDCTTAFTSYTGGQSATITHIVEAQNLQHLKVGTSSAESLTLSFWIKSNTTGNYVAWLYTPDGTARHTNKVFTINTADTWEKKTITVSGDTAGTINNDNGHGMYMRVILASGSGYTSGTSPDGTWEDASNTTNWYAGQAVNLSSSTSNYINITGVQLEVGDTATPFEHRPYDMELARCQRYYYKRADLNTNHIGMADYFSSTIARCGIDLPVTMRTIPSLDIVSGTNYYRISRNGGSDYMNTLSMASESIENFAVIQNSSEVSGTGGQCGFLLTNNSSAFIGFSAEL